MSSLVVAGVVAAGAVVLWTVLGIRLSRTVAVDRRAAAAYLPGVEFDPYHAHAVKSGWPGTTGYAPPDYTRRKHLLASGQHQPVPGS
jgi:hypothetical protein